MGAGTREREAIADRRALRKPASHLPCGYAPHCSQAPETPCLWELEYSGGVDAAGFAGMTGDDKTKTGTRTTVR